jgi:hypothetical protein
MAITKRSDNDGYKRGAMGIDGSKDDAFSHNADQADTDAMYGRGFYQGNKTAGAKSKRQLTEGNRRNGS